MSFVKCEKCLMVYYSVFHVENRILECEGLIDEIEALAPKYYLSKEEEQLITAIIKKFGELKEKYATVIDNDESRFIQFKIEYILACLGVFYEIAGTNFEASPGHPFLIGGIPLSKLIRNSFKGTYYDGKTYDPIFNGELKSVTFEAINSNFSLTRVDEPCGCGTVRVNAANYYFKSPKTWPF